MSNADAHLDNLLETGFDNTKSLDRAFAVTRNPEPPKARAGRELTICHESELPDGGRKIVQDGKRTLGVFRIAGRLHALLNFCPHMGAPLCEGSIHGTHAPSQVGEFDPVLSDQVIRCPWHGWEFDMATGKGLYDAKGRIPVFPVTTRDDGMIIVTV